MLKREEIEEIEEDTSSKEEQLPKEKRTREREISESGNKAETT